MQINEHVVLYIYVDTVTEFITVDYINIVVCLIPCLNIDI